MPNSIESDQTELLARKPAESIAGELNAIALRCAKRPVISDLTDDEILGYDELT